MAVTLQAVDNTTGSQISNAEAALQTQLNSLGDGSQMSVKDMIDLQYNMSVYTLTGNTCSAVMKEISDTLKGIVQKVG